MERAIGKAPLCVKGKVALTYVVSGWIGVPVFFRNIGRLPVLVYGLSSKTSKFF